MTDDPSPTDRELWQRAASGHADSFGVIFDRHASAVHAYCYRRTSSPDIAQDLVSIVFLEAWRRRDDIDLHEQSALPWLLGVAQRVVRQRHRSTLRHRAALARLPAAVVEPDHADAVAARLDDQRRLQHLQDTFARLHRNDQDVLALCVGQGLDYAAAAVALGVPIGTVRSRLSRARRRLDELTQSSSGSASHRASSTGSVTAGFSATAERASTSHLSSSRRNPEDAR